MAKLRNRHREIAKVLARNSETLRQQWEIAKVLARNSENLKAKLRNSETAKGRQCEGAKNPLIICNYIRKLYFILLFTG